MKYSGTQQELIDAIYDERTKPAFKKPNELYNAGTGDRLQYWKGSNVNHDNIYQALINEKADNQGLDQLDVSVTDLKSWLGDFEP